MNNKILIVDDNEKNVTLLKDLLVYYGYQVEIAYDGVEGVEKAAIFKPDVILMDMQMPRLDGIEAGKQIKSNPDNNNVTIIALTSFAMKGDKERILNSGIDHYMPKPIDTRRLPELIKHILEEKDRPCSQ